jgi:hypothetical protein
MLENLLDLAAGLKFGRHLQLNGFRRGKFCGAAGITTKQRLKSADTSWRLSLQILIEP